MRNSKLVFMGMLTLLVAQAGIAQTTKAPAAEAAKVAPAKPDAGKVEVPKGEAIVGYYRFKSGLDMSVQQNGDALVVTSTGQPPQTLSVSADGHLNYPSIAAYLTFDLDPKGIAKTLHFHYDDKIMSGTRIDAAAAKKSSDALELKIKNQTSDPACEKTLRRLIEEARAGKPDYSKMTLRIAQATRTQLPMLQARMQELGAVKEVKFSGVAPQGAEMFDVTFEKGSNQWMVFCLAPGYVSGIGMR